MKKIYESVKIKQITNLQNTVRCHLIIIKNYDQEQKKLLVEESANMLFEYNRQQSTWVRECNFRLHSKIESKGPLKNRKSYLD